MKIHKFAKKALELQEKGKYAEAEKLFRSILATDPKDFVSLFSMGVLAVQGGNPTLALSYFDSAVAVVENHAQAWYNRGSVLYTLKRNEEAVADFDRAIALDPTYVEAYVNRGAALQDMGNHTEALKNFEELLKVAPQNEKALLNKGILLTEFRRYDEAVAVFKRLMEVNPDNSNYGLGQLYFAKMHCCDWEGLEELSAAIVAGVAQGKQVCQPLAFLTVSAQPEEQLRCARIFSSHMFAPQQAPSPRKRDASGKIRLAYVSPDFREHPVAHLMAGVFEAHDKDRFETIAISLGVSDNSRQQSRISAAFDRFYDMRRRPASEIADFMRALDVDIAVDLAGYTADSRTAIFSHRAAPIQVNFLGYPGTLGVSYMDYILGDRFVTPAARQNCFAEAIACLPDAYLPTDSKLAVAPETPPRESFGLPKDGFVFCSFNHAYKITPVVFQAWMRLLKRTPGSVLWLMRLNASAEANLRAEAHRAGVDPERLVFATRVPRVEDHLARYRLADLFLDTSPYNAHTTASDALAVGLPVLTFLGNTFSGRVAASLLHTLGLPEMVADSLEEYEARAVRLANDSVALAAIRDRLEANKKTSPLFDTALFCRHLESAFETMWRTHQSGKKPKSFLVKRLAGGQVPRRAETPSPGQAEAAAPAGPSSGQKRIGLMQTGRIGDIIIAAPIAQHYVDKGYEVLWPVDGLFLPSVQAAFPEIRFLPVDKGRTGFASLEYYCTEPLALMNAAGGCDQVYCLYSYLSGLDIINKKLAHSLKFDEYKYAVSNVPFSRKWELRITRNREREEALFNRLDIRGDYILVHDQGSGVRLDIRLPQDLLATHQEVRISELSSNPFDWLGVMERANMLACIDSCFANLAEQLNFGGKKFMFLRSEIRYTPVLKNGWQFL